MTDQVEGLCECEGCERRHGPVRIERKARVDHGFGACMSHERAGKRLEPGDLDLGAKHVGLRRGRWRSRRR